MPLRSLQRSASGITARCVSAGHGEVRARLAVLALWSLLTVVSLGTTNSLVTPLFLSPLPRGAANACSSDHLGLDCNQDERKFCSAQIWRDGGSG
eukprot:723873-Rhodomonas_salina.1